MSRKAEFVIDDVREDDGCYIVTVSFGLKGQEREWDTLPLRIGNGVEVELSASIVLSTLEGS